MSHPSYDLPSLLQTPMSTPSPSPTVTHILANPPFIPLPDALNIRDLGLLPSSPIPPGLLYRSSALHAIPASSLAALNVKMIVDLRSEREVTAHPNPTIDGVENVWIAGSRAPSPIELGRFVEDGGKRAYAHMYVEVLEMYGGSFGRVVECLRDGQGAVVFHCTGKDRTGVLAALLLSLAGADRDTIAFDYALTRVGVEPSREVLAQMLRLWNKEWTDETPGMREFVQVKGEFVLGFLERVEEKWGSVEGWVREELGFGDEEVEVIKGVLRGEKGRIG